MPKLFNAKEIGERALRKIGAYSINDSGADPEELAEALYWLEMTVSGLAGTKACFWLRTETITRTLTAGMGEYLLETLLGTDNPTAGIVGVVEAKITDGSSETDLEYLRRQEYEDIPNKAASGRPDAIYVNRLLDDETKLFLYPVPATALSIKLQLQTYAPDMTEKRGALEHGFHAEWQKWLALKTAYDAGSGPVRKLPRGELQDIKRDAEDIFKGLNRYNSSNSERTRGRRVKPSD